MDNQERLALNAEFAEKVLGCRGVRVDGDATVCTCENSAHNEDESFWGNLKDYTTRLDLVWPTVEWLNERDISITLQTAGCGGTHYCEIHPIPAWHGSDEDLPAVAVMKALIEVASA